MSTALIVAGSALLLLTLVGLFLPLLRRPTKLPERGQFDRAVYRDQLGEVDNDVARGLLSANEAGPARLEIQRRLLAVKSSLTGPAESSARSPKMAVAFAVVVSVGAGGLYWQLGAPSLPDTPFLIASAQAQNAPSQPSPHSSNGHSDFRAAAEKLQQKLAADPNNAEGWELYARTESRVGDWQRAADAYRRAIDLGRKSAGVYSGLGEMLVLGAQSVVLPPARESFEAALRIDPGDQVSRFYLALADSQGGEAHKAVDAWLRLAADVPDDDPMREEIANRIGVAARSGGFEAPPLPKGRTSADAPDAAGGPNAAQMAAAAQLSPAERDKMIHDMVDQLSAKLAKQPDDADGWLRLANAYGVQGDTDKASDAFDHAMKLRPNDPTIKLESVATMISRLQATDAIPPRAITLLQEVAAVAPDAPEVLWYLGIVAARQGRHDEARQDWTRLLAKLDSGSEDYKTVQNTMAELPPAAR